jgi:hypothetical protein
LQDVFHNLEDALRIEGFIVDNETFDEDEVIVSSLPLDEDIQAPMSRDPFEEPNDDLSHNSRSEEVLEDPSNMTCPF